MQQRKFALYKRRLLSLIPGKFQDIPNREVKIKFLRSSLIEQIEKEKDWQFTGEQAAELIRMAIYPDLRSEEERMQYEDLSISPHPTPTTLNPFNRLNSSGYPLYLL